MNADFEEEYKFFSILNVLFSVGRDSRANNVDSSVDGGNALVIGNNSSSLSPRGMATTPSSGA